MGAPAEVVDTIPLYLAMRLLPGMLVGLALGVSVYIGIKHKNIFLYSQRDQTLK
jgi:hypothetical protein